MYLWCFSCTNNASKSVHDSPAMTMAWDGVRDPILMVLGVLCVLLSLMCAVLATKVMQLKRRPRYDPFSNSISE